ncbi:hypothetical protein ACFL0M_08310 [Thermodesulfobacteriota bacterium]
MTDKEIYKKYHETLYAELHGWRDYELTSSGYGEWYYNCLPFDKTEKILDIGCGDGTCISLLKWNPRHLAYRLARTLWYAILNLIYTIESPAEMHPSSFQGRLVASAIRSS